MTRIDARALRALLDAGGEVALLDVREEGVHSRGHLFLATSAPLSSLELRIEWLVPRLVTTVVLIDDDERLAGRAVKVLAGLGYRDLRVLAGGVPGWRQAGYQVYSGVHVPSKAFGEHVEHRANTPRVSAAELKAKLDAAEDLVVLDSRPMSEYRVMNIPGSADCPGAELVYRVYQAAPRPQTLVVVNCAGRTRSIIGAQSLINAGIPNKVAALKNGTMGWHLAGLELERGQSRVAELPEKDALARANAAAERVAKRFNIQGIFLSQLRELLNDKSKTTYVFDVRSPEEYLAGHLPGSVSAPGGQLVQETETYAAVRNARIALVDDHGVRATMTASWLLQLGWPEVFVVTDGLTGRLESGAPKISLPAGRTISMEELQKHPGLLILDFATSIQYRKGHIPGAAFAIRSRLEKHSDSLKGKAVVCTSPDGVLARYAAADLDAVALEGGTEAWRAAGLPLETGETKMLEPPEDVYYKPYDGRTQVEAAMRDYLQWEVALLEQVRRDPDCRFRDF
jgi:rhodanese-related sulfurtransferase